MAAALISEKPELRAPSGGAVWPTVFAAMIGPQVRIVNIPGRSFHIRSMAGSRVPSREADFCPPRWRDLWVNEGGA